MAAKTKAPAFTGQRVDMTIRARIEGAEPMECQWDARGRMFTPREVVADFGHVTTVRVSGPRVADSCSCDCHGHRSDDDWMPDYSVTYYPDACDPDKRPPEWLQSWLRQAGVIAHGVQMRGRAA